MAKTKTIDKIEETAEEIVETIGEGIKEAVEEAKDAVNEVKETILEKSGKGKKQKEEDFGPKMVFDFYDISEVAVKDAGLKNVINLDYKLVVKSHGRHNIKHGKANVNIIERLINTIAVPGHRGKKHKIITCWASGKYNKNSRMVLEAFKIISEKTKKNPIQVLVDAIENGAPRDEVTMIQYGGARYPQAVDCAPLRRVSLALKNLVHGAYDKSFRSKKSYPQALADEIILASNNDNSSIVVSKKTELEKQADAAR
ncbi:MAG: 30S ribosomal protein S7 [Candidatus Pacearchaeota archaeon]